MHSLTETTLAGESLSAARNAARLARREPVVAALAVGLVVLALFDASQVLPSVEFSLGALIGISPFLLLAVALAAATKASGAESLIAKAFAVKPLTAIFTAALMGALSPFCSCGVIPLIAALLAAGVPLAPVMAFWIASPIMDPEMFILTAAGIGTEFALVKTGAAFGMGLFAGLTVAVTQYFGGLRDVLLSAPSCGGCGPSKQSCGDGTQPEVRWRFWREQSRLEMFGRELKVTGWFLGKWLTVAFFLESLMLAYIPVDLISSLVGATSWYAIPAAAIIGIPTYLNGYAAIPLVSGFIDMGMTPGAAMAFVTAGAVSSIPAAIAVFALVRRAVFILYLLLGLSGATAVGYLYDAGLALVA